MTTTPPTDDLTNSQAELGALLYEDSLPEVPPPTVSNSQSTPDPSAPL
jgi:hypothetical protein